MEDFNQNNINQYPQNPDNNDNRENREYNRPEHSFWAEKVSGTQSYSYIPYQPYQQPAPVPRKKGRIRRVFAFLFKAAVFGIIAGAALSVSHTCITG